MNLPCKELKRIARDNLNGNYKIPMGAFLAATLIPLAVELPFSMLQKDAQPLPVTIMFYVAEFLITLLSMVLSVGIDKEWDSYLKKMEKYGLSDYLAIKQKYFDQYQESLKEEK